MHPVVRNGVSWDGVGKMIGIGKHKDYVNCHCDFVQYKKCRNQWRKQVEALQLQKCGEIFKKHFFDDKVGFDEMLKMQQNLGQKNVLMI